MKLTIAGGCGEHGRNCFYIEGNCTDFLVDCGTMASEANNGYPKLTQEQIRRLKCVFLTHSHADHTGALPWLRCLGYTGPVVASHRTLEQLPFHVEAGIALEDFCPHGKGTINGIQVQWGRSGHCVGSVWYRFSAEGRTTLFSGDYTENTQVYTFDPIRRQTADIAVLDCAYGHNSTGYETACEILIDRVKQLLEKYGLLMFPVPKYGRGLELLRLFRQRELDVPFFGDRHFLRELGRLDEYSGWLKDGWVNLKGAITLFSAGTTRGIVFLSDPQLKQEESQAAATAVLAAGGHAVMTGTVERGSFSAQLLDTGGMELLRYPVHLNMVQMRQLAEVNSFQTVVPYHSAEIAPKHTYSF